MRAQPELRELTGLRFVAALYVFIFHIQINWPIASMPFLKNVLDQGAIGMSLFFILSGFVLAYRYDDGRHSLSDYFVNRFARIYPVYAFAALITVPWMGLDPAKDGTLAAIGQGALLVITNIFMVQAWLPQLFFFWNIDASWSLSVEAFFYLLFPFIIPVLVRLDRRLVAPLFFLLFIASALPGLTARLFPSDFSGVFYVIPAFRLAEFVIGALACILFQRGCRLAHADLWLLAALATLICYLGLFGPAMPLYIGHNWLVVPLIALMVFVLSTGASVTGRVLATPLFNWLGRISYCFYSLQAIVFVPLQHYREGLLDLAPMLADNLTLGLVTLVALTAMSAACYYAVEEPARRYIRRRFATRRPHRTAGNPGELPA